MWLCPHIVVRKVQLELCYESKLFAPSDDILTLQRYELFSNIPNNQRKNYTICHFYGGFFITWRCFSCLIFCIIHFYSLSLQPRRLRERAAPRQLKQASLLSACTVRANKYELKTYHYGREERQARALDRLIT